jgi:hypothetical protein
MARVYPYADSADALFRPAKGLTAADFFQDWCDEDRLEPHLLCAEMSRLAYMARPGVTQALLRAGFTLKTWLGGERLTERFFSWGADGFVATAADGRTMIAFRGTESDKPEDLFADLMVKQVTWRHPGLVHAGFEEAFTKVIGPIRTALDEIGGGPLLITGHSLGAAVATLVAVDLRERHPALMTFGSPRVGNADLARLLDGVTVARFVDCCDVVARIPPQAFNALHIGTLFIEMTGAAALADLTASALSLAFSAFGIAPLFASVGPGRYINAAGAVMNDASPDNVRRDQDAGRQSYRDSHPLPPAHWAAILAGTPDLTGTISASGSARAAVKRVGARLFDGLRRDRVLLRDLADHAPINYVSAMARAFGTESDA